MSWPVVVVVLAFVVVGAVVAGLVQTLAGTIAVAVLVGVLALAVFMPGVCTESGAGTAAASTSCDTIYGASLFEIGGLGEDDSGWALGWGAAALALVVAGITRRVHRPALLRATRT